MSHLLSFTTGFSAMTYDKRSDVGCARPPNQPNWNDCVREIAAKPRTHAPGRSFLYGPWHLVVAGAVALRAAGRPLRRDAWGPEGPSSTTTTGAAPSESESELEPESEENPSPRAPQAAARGLFEPVPAGPALAPAGRSARASSASICCSSRNSYGCIC